MIDFPKDFPLLPTSVRLKESLNTEHCVPVAAREHHQLPGQRDLGPQATFPYNHHHQQDHEAFSDHSELIISSKKCKIISKG